MKTLNPNIAPNKGRQRIRLAAKSAESVYRYHHNDIAVRDAILRPFKRLKLI